MSIRFDPLQIDTLDEVLNVAADVMRDYAGDPGNTRIERLARYVVATLGGEPYTLDSADQLLVNRCLPDHENQAMNQAVAVAYLRRSEAEE